MSRKDQVKILREALLKLVEATTAYTVDKRSFNALADAAEALELTKDEP